MSILPNPLPMKAFSPIIVTVPGMIVDEQPKRKVFDAVSMIALHRSLESKTEFPGSTESSFKPRQLRKASEPMDLTDFGIFRDGRAVQR